IFEGTLCTCLKLYRVHGYSTKNINILLWNTSFGSLDRITPFPCV
ncbi:21839_t:CDS:1, partial [Dentiscutata erythropus]